MDISVWLVTLLGVALVVVALLDVFLTVLHIDLNGPVATAVQRALWCIAVTLASWSVGARRPLVALAGPVMLAATFLAWITLFIIGNALIVWPRLDAYRTEPEIETLTFVDALYYSGVTATVLGYGDITPLTPASRS